MGNSITNSQQNPNPNSDIIDSAVQLDFDQQRAPSVWQGYVEYPENPIIITPKEFQSENSKNWLRSFIKNDDIITSWAINLVSGIESPLLSKLKYSNIILISLIILLIVAVSIITYYVMELNNKTKEIQNNYTELLNKLPNNPQ